MTDKEADQQFIERVAYILFWWVTVIGLVFIADSREKNIRHTGPRATVARLDEGLGFYCIPASDSDAYDITKLIGKEVTLEHLHTP